MKIERYHMEDWLNDSFDNHYNLSSSGCRDFYLKDFLDLCQANMVEFDRLFLGDNDTRGSLKLRQEICKSYQNLPLPQVLVTNGTSEALFTFFNQLLEEGDEVVIPFPAFQCLYQIPLSIGCKLKYLHLMESKDWKLDIEKLAQLVSRQTKLIIINNPHNPVGWTLSEAELRYIGEIAGKNNSCLLFDEHYRYLPIKDGFDLIPSGYDVCKRINEKTFATGSMIKCFGIVGIRIGWLLGAPDFLSKCRDYKDYLTHTIPAVTDHIAYLALKNKEKIIRLKKSHILANIVKLNAFMEKNSHFFQYHEPTGGIVCFPRIKNQPDSRPFCQVLKNKYSVSLLPGDAFGIPAHFRINFGVEPGTFDKALELMQTHLEKI